MPHAAPHSGLDHTGSVFPKPPANQTLGAAWIDIAQEAPPSAPATGTRRLFVDSNTGETSVVRADGLVVSLEAQGAGAAAALAAVDELRGQGNWGDDAGIPGPRGADGKDGRDGIPGQPGDDGEEGSVGAPGRDGAAGRDGRDGGVGEAGEDGDPGAPGPKGEKGEKGDKGDKGDPGEDGEDGPPGPPGKDGSAGAGTNALLDGANHTDTAAGTVARGDIIVGNSTPKWARLALGAAGTSPWSDGTDLAYGVGLESEHAYVALATEVLNSVAGAVAATNNIQNASSTDATSYATAAVTFTANRLALISVLSVVGSGTVNQATATQAGATPRTLTAVGYVTTGQIGITVFRCAGSTASSSGAITFDFNGQTQLRAAWIVDEFSNIDPGGYADNGASCIVHQTPPTNTGTGTTASVTLAAFEGDGAAGYGVFGNNGNHAFTASNGYTGTGTATAEALAVIRGVFDGSNPAVAPSATLTSDTWIGVGVEIRRDPGWYLASENPWTYAAANFPTGKKLYPQGFIRTTGGITDGAVIQFYDLSATPAYIVESVLTATPVTASNYTTDPTSNIIRYTTGIAKGSLTDTQRYTVRCGGIGDAQVGIKGLSHTIY